MFRQKQSKRITVTDHFRQTPSVPVAEDIPGNSFIVDCTIHDPKRYHGMEILLNSEVFRKKLLFQDEFAYLHVITTTPYSHGLPHSIILKVGNENCFASLKGGISLSDNILRILLLGNGDISSITSLHVEPISNLEDFALTHLEIDVFHQDATTRDIWMLHQELMLSRSLIFLHQKIPDQKGVFKGKLIATNLRCLEKKETQNLSNSANIPLPVPKKNEPFHTTHMYSKSDTTGIFPDVGAETEVETGDIKRDGEQKTKQDGDSTQSLLTRKITEVMASPNFEDIFHKMSMRRAQALPSKRQFNEDTPFSQPPSEAEFLSAPPRLIPTSGFVTASTKIFFRTKSGHQYMLIQLSRELYQPSACGKSFFDILDDFFRQYAAVVTHHHLTHRLSIIVFGKILHRKEEKYTNESKENELAKSERESKSVENFFDVAFEGHVTILIENLNTFLSRMKHLLFYYCKELKRELKLDKDLQLEPSIATDGNFFEALSLLMFHVSNNKHLDISPYTFGNVATLLTFGEGSYYTSSSSLMINAIDNFHQYFPAGLQIVSLQEQGAEHRPHPILCSQLRTNEILLQAPLTSQTRQLNYTTLVRAALLYYYKSEVFSLISFPFHHSHKANAPTELWSLSSLQKLETLAANKKKKDKIEAQKMICEFLSAYSTRQLTPASRGKSDEDSGSSNLSLRKKEDNGKGLAAPCYKEPEGLGIADAQKPADELRLYELEYISERCSKELVSILYSEGYDTSIRFRRQLSSESKKYITALAPSPSINHEKNKLRGKRLEWKGICMPIVSWSIFDTDFFLQMKNQPSHQIYLCTSSTSMTEECQNSEDLDELSVVIEAREAIGSGDKEIEWSRISREVESRQLSHTDNQTGDAEKEERFLRSTSLSNKFDAHNRSTQSHNLRSRSSFLHKRNSSQPFVDNSLLSSFHTNSFTSAKNPISSHQNAIQNFLTHLLFNRLANGFHIFSFSCNANNQLKEFALVDDNFEVHFLKVDISNVLISNCSYIPLDRVQQRLIQANPFNTSFGVLNSLLTSVCMKKKQRERHERSASGREKSEGESGVSRQGTDTPRWSVHYAGPRGSNFPPTSRFSIGQNMSDLSYKTRNTVMDNLTVLGSLGSPFCRSSLPFPPSFLSNRLSAATDQLPGLLSNVSRLSAMADGSADASTLGEDLQSAKEGSLYALNGPHGTHKLGHRRDKKDYDSDQGTASIYSKDAHAPFSSAERAHNELPFQNICPALVYLHENEIVTENSPNRLKSQYQPIDATSFLFWHRYRGFNLIAKHNTEYLSPWQLRSACSSQSTDDQRKIKWNLADNFLGGQHSLYSISFPRRLSNKSGGLEGEKERDDKSNDKKRENYATLKDDRGNVIYISKKAEGHIYTKSNGDEVDYLPRKAISFFVIPKEPRQDTMMEGSIQVDFERMGGELNLSFPFSHMTETSSHEGNRAHRTPEEDFTQNLTNFISAIAQYSIPTPERQRVRQRIGQESYAFQKPDQGAFTKERSSNIIDIPYYSYPAVHVPMVFAAIHSCWFYNQKVIARNGEETGENGSTERLDSIGKPCSLLYLFFDAFVRPFPSTFKMSIEFVTTSTVFLHYMLAFIKKKAEKNNLSIVFLPMRNILTILNNGISNTLLPCEVIKFPMPLEMVQKDILKGEQENFYSGTCAPSLPRVLYQASVHIFQSFHRKLLSYLLSGGLLTLLASEGTMDTPFPHWSLEKSKENKQSYHLRVAREGYSICRECRGKESHKIEEGVWILIHPSGLFSIAVTVDRAYFFSYFHHMDHQKKNNSSMTDSYFFSKEKNASPSPITPISPSPSLSLSMTLGYTLTIMHNTPSPQMFHQILDHGRQLLLQAIKHAAEET